MTPQIVKSNEILNLVKDKLIQQEENVEILAQVKFESTKSFLPSLKTESLILFKNMDTQVTQIAKTTNLMIDKLLTVDEFKEFVSNLREVEQIKFEKMLEKVEPLKRNKPKM